VLNGQSIRQRRISTNQEVIELRQYEESENPASCVKVSNFQAQRFFNFNWRLPTDLGLEGGVSF